MLTKHASRVLVNPIPTATLRADQACGNTPSPEPGVQAAASGLTSRSII